MVADLLATRAPFFKVKKFQITYLPLLLVVVLNVYVKV